MIMREIGSGPLLEGRAFFEHDKLIAESRSLGRFVGSPSAFWLHHSTDANLRKIILMLGLT